MSHEWRRKRREICLAKRSDTFISLLFKRLRHLKQGENRLCGLLVINLQLSLSISAKKSSLRRSFILNARLNSRLVHNKSFLLPFLKIILRLRICLFSIGVLRPRKYIPSSFLLKGVKRASLPENLARIQSHNQPIE